MLRHVSLCRVCVITCQNYDYYPGGKDNYAVDRQVVGEMLKIVPDLPQVAACNPQVLSAGCATWPARRASGSSWT
jgi:S-adenosyl methyltransferase